MTDGLIIQSRLGSTRLPRKALLTIQKKELITHLIDRLKYGFDKNQIVLATTTLDEDYALVEIAKREGVLYYRGSVENVLERMLYAAKEYNFETIVRLTGDNPLVDAQLVQKLLDEHHTSGADFTSTLEIEDNKIINHYPKGLSISVIDVAVLKEISHENLKQYHKEHVIPYFYENREKFKIKIKIVTPNFQFPPNTCLTVDHPEDFILINRIFECLYPKNHYFSVQDVITLINEKPELCDINSGIRRKGPKDYKRLKW